MCIYIYIYITLWFLTLFPNRFKGFKETSYPNKFIICFVLSCDLLGYLGPEIYLAGRHSSQALPPALMGGIKYPSTWARNTSSPPMYYSGGAEGSSGGGGSCGKYSPTPTGGSAGLSLHLNPTTLAMLQQHNYIPYFRGISD